MQSTHAGSGKGVLAMSDCRNIVNRTATCMLKEGKMLLLNEPMKLEFLVFHWSKEFTNSVPG